MGEGHAGEPKANHERLTVAQAATALGITEGAVRSRIKRGTLPTTKEGGAVFVLWGSGTSQANQPPNTGAPGDREADVSPDPTDELGKVREELGAEQTRRERAESTLHKGMDEARWRREEAERERDDLRRELFALRQQQRESTETAEEQQVRGSVQPEAPGVQEGARRRPWWRRIIRG